MTAPDIPMFARRLTVIVYFDVMLIPVLLLGTDGPWLSGFGESDSEGLLNIMPFPRHLGSWNVFAIVSNIRTGHADVLAPFGLRDSGDAKPDLNKFLMCCADIAMLNTAGAVTEGRAALSASHRTILMSVLTTLAQLAGAALAKGAVTPTHVKALQDVVTVMPPARLGVPGAAFDFPLLAQLYLDGKLNLDQMVTQEIGLGDVEAAFHKMEEGNVIRSVIRF